MPCHPPLQVYHNSNGTKKTSTIPKRKPHLKKHKLLRNPDCSQSYALFTEGSNGWNTKPHQQCIECFRKSRKRNRQRRNPPPNAPNPAETANNNALNNAEVGGIFSQIATVSFPSSDKQQMESGIPSNATPEHSEVIAVATQPQQRKSIQLPHLIFSKGEWRRARIRNHPKVNLRISIDRQDYTSFGAKSPHFTGSSMSALTDSGAQSNLWSYDDCMAAGFKHEDLIPVSMDLEAANRSPITIEGGLLL